MKKRTRSRELALQFLYQLDLLGTGDLDGLTDFLREEADDAETARYARTLVEGTYDAIPELDEEAHAQLMGGTAAKLFGFGA